MVRDALGAAVICARVRACVRACVRWAAVFCFKVLRDGPLSVCVRRVSAVWSRRLGCACVRACVPGVGLTPARNTGAPRACTQAPEVLMCPDKSAPDENKDMAELAYGEEVRNPLRHEMGQTGATAAGCDRECRPEKCELRKCLMRDETRILAATLRGDTRIFLGH
jgi:hypothetical protein